MLNGFSKREQLEPRKKETKFYSKQLNLSSFFKSPCSGDVDEAKSSSTSSLMLRDEEDYSNSILMFTLDDEETKQASS